MTAQQPQEPREPEKTFLITEEIAELIESQLSNPHCKKCPYEGGGINSGIKSMLRSRGPIRQAAIELCALDEINRRLQKLYPDDLSLQLNLTQIRQLQKEHDAAIAAKVRGEVLDKLVKWLNDCDGGDVAFLPNGIYSAPNPFNVKGLLKKIKSLMGDSND